MVLWLAGKPCALCDMLPSVSMNHSFAQRNHFNPFRCADFRPVVQVVSGVQSRASEIFFFSIPLREFFQNSFGCSKPMSLSQSNNQRILESSRSEFRCKDFPAC